MDAITKLCRRCGTAKPRAEFSIRSDRPCGLQARCKRCQSEMGERRRAIARATRPSTRKGPLPRPAIDRLRQKYVVRDAGHDTQCWMWTASTNALGYGKFGIRGGWKPSHRVSYELHVGPVPDGLELDHLCRNPRCVNPDHLEPVTHAENVRRGDARNNGQRYRERRTHCARGHALTAENEYRWRGLRMCRACRAASSRASLELLRGHPLGPRGQDKTRCHRGHEYTPENTRRDRRGCRTCRTCERALKIIRRSMARSESPCTDSSARSTLGCP